jgi:hypothetical protein
MSDPNDESSSRSRTILTLAGLLLIVLGILFLIGQMINVDVERLAWPFFVIVPGILVFYFALGRGNQAGERLAMVGSAAAMVGTILLFQNTFDYFQSWAYAWALVFPTSVGVGQIIYGSIKNRADMSATGRGRTVVGIILFVVLAVFFEFVIGFGGRGIGLGGLGWPVVLIVVGVVLLVGGYVLDRLRR